MKFVNYINSKIKNDPNEAFYKFLHREETLLVMFLFNIFLLIFVLVEKYAEYRNTFDYQIRNKKWEIIYDRLMRGEYPEIRHVKLFVSERRPELINFFVGRQYFWYQILISTAYIQNAKWVLENTKVSACLFISVRRRAHARRDLELYPSQEIKLILFDKRKDIEQKTQTLECLDLNFEHYTLLNVVFTLTYFNHRKELYELKKNYNDIASSLRAQLID